MKRILYVILSLALLVGLLVPAATPILAESPKVAVYASTWGATNHLTDVQNKLVSTGLFSQVDAIRVDPEFPVPALAELQQYSAVLVYSDGDFNDHNALGNVLADYIDAGGGVVVATFAFYDPVVGGGVSNFGIGGRMSSGGYLPFTQRDQSQGTPLTLVADLPSHPILSGVSSFSGGSSSYHDDISLASGATLVAHWSNNYPLIATKVPPNAGRVVGLNFFPPSSDVGGDLWDASTDGDLIMANSLIWAGGSTPTITIKAENDGTPLAAPVAWLSNVSSGTGAAPFKITDLVAGQELSLTAQATYSWYSQYAFDHWTVGTTDYEAGDRDITFTVNETVTATAHYSVLPGPNYITEPHAELDPSYTGKLKDKTPPLTEADTNKSTGWWWRNTTNQNNLWSYTANNFPNKLITAYESAACKVLVWSGQPGSNVVAVIGPTGNTIIGCGGSRNAARVALSVFAQVVPNFQLNLRGIIFTDCNGQTIWGGADFIGVGVPRTAPVLVYGQAGIIEVGARNQAVSTAIIQRDLYTMGPQLPYGPNGNLGIGSAFGFNPYQTDKGLIYPNRLVSAQTTVTLGGVSMSLIPSAAAEDAGLAVFLPTQKVLIVGEIFGKYFPPIGAPTGPDIPITKWINTLDSWIDLNANVLASLHALPITAAVDVTKALTDQKNALTSVHTQTVSKINLVMSLDDIVASVSIPQPLASQPYVQPLTSSVANAVRAVYHYYMGWFDGEVDSLNTLSGMQQAQFIVDLAGGPGPALTKARKLEEAPFGDTGASCQEAIILTKALRVVSPSHDADVIYIAALRKMGYSQTSGQLRNYYLLTAQRAEAAMQ